MNRTEGSDTHRSVWDREFSLRGAFVLFSYLLAGMGLTCLVLSEIFSPQTGLALTFSLLVCYILERKKIIPVSPPSRYLLSKWSLLALPAIYFALDVPLLDLVVWFVAFLLFTRFVFKSELNDYLFGYLIAIVCLLIGALFVQDMVFGIIFLAFYLVLCWSLIFYNMTVERVGHTSPPETFKHVGDRERLGAPLFALSTTLVILSLILTAAIFISFPRLGLGFMSLNTNAPPISGFSETVTLGDVGRIKLNDSVVMRVEYFQNGRKIRPPEPVYWRGVVLDRYDGKNWSNTLPVEWKLRKRRGSEINLFSVQPGRNIVTQEVFREYIDSDVVFTHGIPLTLDGNFRIIQMDQNFALKTESDWAGPRRFTLVSEIGHPQVSYDLEMPRFDASLFPARFLQLPPVSLAIRQLADRLIEKTSTPEARAQNILRHFSGFGYSLEMVGQETDESALDHFLFQRKKGHCEYFAAAMVVLLRQAGIPARMVNGFAGGEWNELGEYLILRQKHAHSWVEAFLPQRGWVLFDPTPPDPSAPNRVTDSALLRAIDYMRLNWQRYVIRYSFRDQLQILTALRSGGSEIMHQVRKLGALSLGDIQKWIQSHSRLGLTLLLAAGLGLLLKRRFPDFRFGRPTPIPFATVVYREMLKRLERQGFPKKPHWTHWEYVDRLESLAPEKLGPVREITRYYESRRFAHLPADPGLEKNLLQAARKL
ncbi:MAG: hypothetical protein COV67_05055 [Nitrospinae bacterium CG11_big_fil_rev_8_21_14_0_20_56_8]|nr:MAG: hypothetical protein COV67_05055 [Nitrospinae bacterium CG11_big_fil_rev_8_21_14_0_20_56_8]